MGKKLLSVLLTLLMVITVLPVMSKTVDAETAPGTEGNPWEIGSPTASNVTAYLTDNGDDTKTLHIQGTGAMKDFGRYSAPWYDTENDESQNAITTAIIGEGVTSIGNNSFLCCQGLETVTIPPTVTSIGDSAFEECNKLASIDIPEGVTKISDSTFAGCGSLRTVNIPSAITSIGNYAFNYCNELDYITIPSTVTSIGENAFYDLREVTFMPAADKSTIKIGEYAFVGYEVKARFGNNENNTKLFNGNTEIKAGDFIEGISNKTLTWKAPVVEYPLWVGGTQVTSANAANITGSETPVATYNAETNTLTLNGASITTGYMPPDQPAGTSFGIYYNNNNSDTLNIFLSGTNEIGGEDSSVTTGINNAGSINISGEGSLTVSASATGITSGSAITISRGTVAVETTDESGMGIASPSLTINGGKVTVVGGLMAIASAEVKNAIAGTGWTNTAGTEGKADIAKNTSGQDLSSYKKVQFPAVAHEHDEIVFTSWTSTNSLPSEAGNYYLKNNVTLSDAWTVPDGITNLCLNGHTIKYNGRKGYANIIDVNSGATLNLYDEEENNGKIQGFECTSPGNLGTVNINGGSFTMNGGTIQGPGRNYVTGAGVFVGNSGNATLSGGTVTGYSNGVLTSNSSSHKNSITVTGGNITDNGTGIAFGDGKNLTITGGRITGNYNGVRLTNPYADFSISGSPYIYGNINYENKNSNLSFVNVYNVEMRINITGTGELSENTKIGVKSNKYPIIFTNGWNTYMSDKDPTNYFSSDDNNYSVLQEGNELKLGKPHTHEWSSTAEGAVITATCADGDGGHGTPKTATLTINAPALKTYGGSESADATITGTIDGVETPAVVYKKGDETLSAAPTEPGDYVAQITLGTGDNSVTAFIGYTIAKAQLADVSVEQNGTLTYNGEAQTPAVTTAATAKGDQTVTFTYSKTQDGEYTSTVPSITNVSESGTFYYKASAPNHEDASGTFTVTMNKATAPEVVTPTPEAVTYDPNKTLANIELSGGWSWADDTVVPTVKNEGYEAQLSVTDDDNYDYSAVEGYNADTHKVIRTVTLTVNKADNPATVSSTASVKRGGNEADLSGNVTLNGATGTVSYEISGDAKGCSINEKGILSSGTDTGEITVNVTVAEDDNYKASDVKTITATITEKDTQTISAEDVTATIGDTGVKINATITTGDGSLSYKVTSGDAVTVDNSGNLTILKEGKAVVTITASETKAYAEESKEVTVTINPIDKSKLESAIEAAKAYYDSIKDVSDFKKEAEEVKTLIETAQTALEEGRNQQEINDATTALNNALAGNLKKLSDKLPETDKATLDNEETIKAADKALNVLTTDQKALVDNSIKVKIINDAALVTAIRNGKYFTFKGDGGSWTKGSSSSLPFTIKHTLTDDPGFDLGGNVTYRSFKGIKVDGKSVSEKTDGKLNYTYIPGSVKIDLLPDYLKNLSVGDHTLTVEFAGNMSATAKFKVLKESSSGGNTPYVPPKTGIE